MKNVFAICMAVLVICAVGCSKEKRLDNRLSGNTWNIDRIEWVKTESSFADINVSTGIETDAGTFQFEETTGTSNMTIDGVTEENVAFSWSVSSEGDEINVTYDVNIDGTSSNQRVLVIEENKRKRQTWILTEQRIDLDTEEVYQLVAEITLSR